MVYCCFTHITPTSSILCLDFPFKTIQLLGYPHFWKPPNMVVLWILYGVYIIWVSCFFKWVLLIGFIIMRFLWGLYERKDIGLNIIGCIVVIMIIIVYQCLRYVLRDFFWLKWCSSYGLTYQFMGTSMDFKYGFIRAVNIYWPRRIMDWDILIFFQIYHLVI